MIANEEIEISKFLSICQKEDRILAVYQRKGAGLTLKVTTSMR